MNTPKQVSESTSSDMEDTTQLIARWRDGDENAATELFNRYQKRLFPLVASKLSERMKRRMDPEDMVMSIMRSVFRMTGEQTRSFSDERGFWKWFVTVALNKTYNRIDKMTTIKEGLLKDVSSEFDDRIGGEPTADEVVEFTDLLDRVLSQLDDEQRRVLLAKMEGLSQSEIADQMRVSTKTIQRMGPQIRRIAAASLGENLPEGLLTEAEYSGYWDELCSEPLAGWLNGAILQSAQQLGLKTIGDAISSLTVPLAVLERLKSVFKQRGRMGNVDVDSENIYPAKTLATAYLATIAKGQILLSEKLSEDSVSQIQQRIDSILKEGWLSHETRRLLVQYRDGYCS